MHLSQPSLSIAIKNLEETLGGKLFARTTRSVALTPEGKAFYPVAKRLLADWDQSLQDVRTHFELLRGKVELAAIPTYTINLLPTILAKFHEMHPAINVTVQDVIAERVLDMVREGRCELGVTFEPAFASDLVFEPLFSDRFVALLPNKHPLLNKAKLTWSDLLEYPHISLSRPASIRMLIDQALEQKGLSLSPMFETQQLVSVGRMVEAGLGLSVVPSTSRKQLQASGLVCREISAPVINCQLGLVMRRKHELSAAGKAMKKLIQSMTKDKA